MSVYMTALSMLTDYVMLTSVALWPVSGGGTELDQWVESALPGTQCTTTSSHP